MYCTFEGTLEGYSRECDAVYMGRKECCIGMSERTSKPYCKVPVGVPTEERSEKTNGILH